MDLGGAVLDRSGPRGGYTLIELLAVIATVGVLIVLIVPTTQAGRQIHNQQLARLALLEILAAEDSFRSFDRDGDGVDDYATLAELGALGIVGSDLADGLYEGYTFSVTPVPPPGPWFEARATPASPKTGILRFYGDPSGILRFSEIGIPGPGDPVLGDGDELLLPFTPEQLECRQELVQTLQQTIGALGALVGIDAAQQAAVLVSDHPELVSAILAVSADDGEVSLELVLAADWLGWARSVIGELGLPPGPDVGTDAELLAWVGDLQASLVDAFAFAADSTPPPTPLAEIPTAPQPVVSFLVGPDVPALPALGVVALVAGMMLVAAGLAGRR